MMNVDMPETEQSQREQPEQPVTPEVSPSSEVVSPPHFSLLRDTEGTLLVRIAREGQPPETMTLEAFRQKYVTLESARTFLREVRASFGRLGQGLTDFSESVATPIPPDTPWIDVTPAPDMTGLSDQERVTVQTQHLQDEMQMVTSMDKLRGLIGRYGTEGGLDRLADDAVERLAQGQAAVAAREQAEASDRQLSTQPDNWPLNWEHLSVHLEPRPGATWHEGADWSDLFYVYGSDGRQTISLTKEQIVAYRDQLEPLLQQAQTEVDFRQDQPNMRPELYFQSPDAMILASQQVEGAQSADLPASIWIDDQGRVAINGEIYDPDNQADQTRLDAIWRDHPDWLTTYDDARALFVSHRYRREQEHSPRQVLISEHMRTFFTGQEYGQAPEDVDYSRAVELVAGLNHQSYQELIARDELARVAIVSNPDGSFSLNPRALTDCFARQDPRDAVRFYGGSQLLRHLVGDHPDYQPYLAAYDAFQERVPQMEREIDEHAQAILDYYGFRPLSEYPPQQQRQQAILMATLLNEHVNKNVHYDSVFMHERDFIPRDQQHLYEHYLASREGRGICSSYSYMYQDLLRRVGIDTTQLIGYNRSDPQSTHAYVGVGIPDESGQVREQYIFCPTSGEAGRGTRTYGVNMYDTSWISFIPNESDNAYSNESQNLPTLSELGLSRGELADLFFPGDPEVRQLSEVDFIRRLQTAYVADDNEILSRQRNFFHYPAHR